MDRRNCHVSALQERYSLLKEHGWVDGVRSDVVGVPSSGSMEDPIYHVAGATVIEGAYKAFADWPDSPNVKFTLQKGLEVQLLDTMSTDAVLRFFNEIGNDFTTSTQNRSSRKATT